MACHNYISLYLFIFVYFVFKIESFTPLGRLSHSSVLAGNKLYFFGGILNGVGCSNEVFYLDVSRSFDMATPPWNDLTPKAGISFKSCWGTTPFSAINNEQTIYLFNGVTFDKNTNSLISVSDI